MEGREQSQRMSLAQGSLSPSELRESRAGRELARPQTPNRWAVASTHWLPYVGPILPTPSRLTDGVARGSHSCPSPIWCWVERLLNFGPDDPATASKGVSHTGHSCPCSAQPDQAPPLSSLPSAACTSACNSCHRHHTAPVYCSSGRRHCCLLPCPVSQPTCSLVPGRRMGTAD